MARRKFPTICYLHLNEKCFPWSRLVDDIGNRANISRCDIIISPYFPRAKEKEREKKNNNNNDNDPRSNTFLSRSEI